MNLGPGGLFLGAIGLFGMFQWRGSQNLSRGCSRGTHRSPKTKKNRTKNPFCQKNPRAHKNKIGTPGDSPPQKKNPNTLCKTGNFMGMEGFPAERTQPLHAPIKLAQPFLAPELRAKNIYGHEAFSDFGVP